MNLPLPQSPLRFHPVYKDYIWGGDRIAKAFGRHDAPAVCAESWEVSAHPNGMSIVSEGPLAGLGLDELCRRYGRALLGTRAQEADRFPLLFKVIDARRNLSVQVHPSAADPTASPRDIKNECWFLLDATETALLHAGFRDGIDRPALDKALATGSPRIDALLRHHPVRKEDTLMIPAGRVHAIGAGCLVYEVQQSADITYRFYDWDRVDASGHGRPLHIPEALRSIDWGLPVAATTSPRPLPGAPGLSRCLRTPFFTLGRLAPGAPLRLDTHGESFHVLFVDNGSLRLVTPAGEETVGAGTSVLLPAATGPYEAIPLSPGSTALLTHL